MIRRLQEDVNQLERAAEESLRRTRTEADKQEAAERKNSEGKLTKLQQELAEVRAQYASVLATHRSGEQALRKVGDRAFHSESESVCVRCVTRSSSPTFQSPLGHSTAYHNLSAQTC